jgi:pyridoxal phosphate enzyme (YggS family)
MSDHHDPRAGLRAVLDDIRTATAEAGRPAYSVTLVAVSKTHDAAAIRLVLDDGHRVFGENRVQEAEDKWPALRQDFRDIELHLIGPLQSNKAKEAVALFDVIESIDRPKIAEALAREMERQGRRPRCLVQVNTGKEPQKAGIAPEDTDAFITACRDTWNLPVEGLMCIPPVDEEPALHFALLRELARRNGLPLLSMGMSSDFRTAIELGATHVRVGTAVFGSRPKL